MSSMEHGHNDRPANAVADGGIRKPRKSRGKGLRTTNGCSGNSDIVPIHHVYSTAEPSTAPVPAPVRPAVQSQNTAPAPHRTSQHHHQSSFSTASEPRSNSQIQQWPSDSGVPMMSPEDPMHVASPRSSYSNSTGYGMEVAPLRWFGLLAGDAASSSFEVSPLDPLNDPTQAQRFHPQADGLRPRELSTPRSIPTSLPDGVNLHDPHKLLQISAISPTPPNGAPDNVDERHYWQASEPVQLNGEEHEVFHYFVTSLSLWIDLFDPMKHFSTFVPHLALRNQGLMKAILALGSRHLSIKPLREGESNVGRTAAVQYYYETLQYLQSAMRFTSYKNSLELLATVLVVSTYEMIDGAGKGWERHLKGVFWIQRGRNINGESGGLEQAIWWAWLRQDVWAAFREHRRCFSFFKPTKPYHAMDIWDLASKVVYILAQSVNYASDEEKQGGERDLSGRIIRANTLLNMLDEWRKNITIHFEPLPVQGPMDRAFRPLWVHPSAFGTSMQMYSMARILLLIHQPAAGGYLEYLGRDKVITDSVDTIGGIALKLTDNASRLMSTQCLFAAGLYCTDSEKRKCISDLITDHSLHTGWPSNMDLAEELQVEWSKQKPA
ncbi:hypothetical protein D0863_01857 [Hortaea werneckii]|uniref:Transcription factor domain-containing protein n=1 Tax=Hortaea werneckii TaxID=91943 RepID=A0A3M7EJ81_HORWE|nr:hypothetical protein D0863_01857 [Hortaea werneckii]